MAKRKPAKSTSSRPRRAAGKAFQNAPVRLDESVVRRVRDYCRSNARMLVVVGAHFDQLYATDVLDLRRRVSLGLEPTRELEFVLSVNGAVAASRTIKVNPEPDSWVSKQEWSVDTSSAAHLRMRLHAALHDYRDRVLPTLDTARFISDHALCALYLTWMLSDEGAGALRPYSSSCQGLPWDGEYGRASLASEWFTRECLAAWEPLLERSLALVGVAHAGAKSGSVSVVFEQAAEAGDILRLGDEASPQADAESVSFVAKAVVRLNAQDLRRFDPTALSLQEIGGRYFRLVGAQAMALLFARSGEIGFLDEASWTRIHTQFRLALAFATRCAGSLGVRLRATGLVPDPMQVEKRAGEIVRELKHLDLQQCGVTPGDQRVGTVYVPQIRALAEELARIGVGFAHVSPASELEGWQNVTIPKYYDEPLSETSVLTAAVLCQEPLDHGLTAANIVVKARSRYGESLESTSVKRAVNGQLKPWGAKFRKRFGYYVPMSKRIALWTRIRPTLEQEYGHRAPDS
jgi:hypothetical protein